MQRDHQNDESEEARHSIVGKGTQKITAIPYFAASVLIVEISEIHDRAISNQIVADKAHDTNDERDFVIDVGLITDSHTDIVVLVAEECFGRETHNLKDLFKVFPGLSKELQ